MRTSGRRVFASFAIGVGLMTASFVTFLQTRSFAEIVKRLAASYLPGDLGLRGDFSDFSIHLFPPAISINRPSVHLTERNILKLPVGASVAADRIDVRFRPLQVFSGRIRASEVRILRGAVFLPLESIGKPAAKVASAVVPSASPRPVASSGFHWDRLLEFRTDAVELLDTQLRFEVKNPSVAAELTGKRIALRQLPPEKGPIIARYGLDLELDSFRGRFPEAWKLPAQVDRLQGSAVFSPEGIRVEQLSLAQPGLELKASGKITGDWVNALAAGDAKKGSLPFEGNVVSVTDVERFLGAIGIDRGEAPVSGKVQFDGKIAAETGDVLGSLEASGSLRWRDAKLGAWQADAITAEGEWAKGGHLTLLKAEAEQKETPRGRGDSPGLGGKIKLSAPLRFRMQAGAQSGPVAFGLELERAHLHWLAASAIKELYPLDFRATGKIQGIFDPAAGPARRGKTPWALSAQSQLEINQLILDNQRWGKKLSRRETLNVKDIRLDGDFRLDPRGFFPGKLQLRLPNSSLMISGGLSFPVTWDLKAVGQVDLKDLQTLSGVPIRGAGALALHVHGPSSRVILDFDGDLKEAEYLHLQFGDFRGKVNYDEDPEILTFRGIDLKRGNTPYRGEGEIRFAEENRVALRIGIPRGNIGDFQDIFDYFVKDLWWFPRSLMGPMSGEVTVSGGLSIDSLVVAGNLQGENWDFYRERFRRISLKGGLDRGRYHISAMEALKKTGKILSRVSYSPDERLDWGVRTEGLQLTDLDAIARLDVPVRGTLSLQSEGKGKLGSIAQKTFATVSSFGVRGTALPASELRVESANGITQGKAVILGGQGLLEGSYDFEPGGKAFLKGRADSLDFSPLLLLLNPRFVQDAQLTGRLSGAGELAFRSGDFEHLSGKIAIDDYRLAHEGAAFSLESPVRVSIERGTFQLPEVRFQGPDNVTTLSLVGQNALLSGKIGGMIDLSILEFLTPTIFRASGGAALDLSIAGTLKAPDIAGQVDLRSGSLRLASLETPFENILGAIRVRQGRLSFQDLRADLARGRVEARGAVEVFADRMPKLEIDGNIQGSRVKVYPFQFARTRGDLRVRGDTLPYLVEGDLVVDSALSTIPMAGSKSGAGTRVSRFAPPAGAGAGEERPLFQLNLRVDSPGGIIVQNELLDLEAKGRLRIINTLETPRVLGDAQLVQGRVVFKDRSFQISSGVLSFDNPAVIDPKFTMTASTEVNGVRIQIFASGRSEQYKIELSSSPTMPESEILSLLALGFTNDDVTRSRSTERGVVQQGEAASLVLHSTDFNRDLKNKTGLQIQIDEAVNTQVGTSIFRPRSDTDPVSTPKIVIRRQIGNRVDVSVGSTVGVGSNTQRQVNAEFKVTPGFSVMGVWDTLESTSSQTQQSSYGVDLKLQKRFK